MPKPTFYGNPIEPLEARIVPATFTVTTAADSGAGSLRQAILDANALAGRDTITFTNEFLQARVPIAVASELPIVSDSVLINGSGFYKAQLDGTNAGEGAHGLVFSGASTVDVVGLEISGFARDGIVVAHGTDYSFDQNIVRDNHGNGIRIFGSTDLSLYRNTIVGNGGTGILLEESGRAKIGSVISEFAESYFNTIEGNGLFGVAIRGGGDNSLGTNKIRGNGGLAEAGEGGGIAVINAQNTKIGDFCRTEGFRTTRYYIVGNTIEANHGVGVLIDYSSDTVLAGNTITANASDGVLVDAASNTKFSALENNSYFTSHTDTLVGNTIASNGGWGVTAVNGSSQVDIRGNVLGPNADGGILLDGVNGAVIGGTTTYYYTNSTNVVTKEQTSSDRNIINAGSQPGVVIKNGSGVSLISNQFSGTGLPIDLGGDSATLNDLGDPDAGANHLQNYPVLEYAGSGTSSETKAVLDTDAAATVFRVQIYSYDITTSTYTVVATQNVTTDANGDAGLMFAGLSGPALFATATNLTTGETSELSPVAREVPRLNIGSLTFTEGNNGVTNAVLTVSLGVASQGSVTVNYATVNGTAIVGLDYSAVSGTLVFAPGETTKIITIPVTGDTVQEASESFYVDLSGAQGVGIGQGRGEVKIVNDDALPTISIEDAVVLEGSNLSSTRPGYTEYQYRVTLSSPSLDPVTVRLKSVGGTATVGLDYEAVNETISFAPGVTSLTKTVFIPNDGVAELNETVQFQLSEPSAVVIGNGAGTLTIADDDGWTVVLDPVEIIEGSTQTSKIVPMTMRLVNSLGLTDHLAPIRVEYLAQDGSAVGGMDYQFANGFVTFQPGELAKTINVGIIGDQDDENNETFTIKFGAVVGAKGSTTPGVVTIVDDDDLPTINIADVSIVEGEDISSARPGYTAYKYQISLSRPSLVPVTVRLTSIGGTATIGSDYDPVDELVTFSPGETSATKVVYIKDDATIERDESVFLLLSDAVSGAISKPMATLTIVDDDDPGLTITKGGRRATWIDADGDRVKLVVSRPMLTPERFFFGWDQEGRSVLATLSLRGDITGRALPVSLDLSVEQRGDGDGRISLASIDAMGRDLGTVRVEGNLGMIFAGDGNLKKPGVGRLTVDSFGQHPGGAEFETSMSAVEGGIGSFRVKGDFNGAHLYVHEGDLGSLSVGGNVAGSLIAVGAAPTSSTRVGKVTVRGDWIASSLAVGASAGSDDMFGTEDDDLFWGLHSKIAQITIGGAVAGTPEAEDATDHFGFVAGKIAAFQVGKTRLPLSSSENDVLALGETSDVILRELGIGTAK